MCIRDRTEKDFKGAGCTKRISYYQRQFKVMGLLLESMEPSIAMKLKSAQNVREMFLKLDKLNWLYPRVMM